MYDKLLTALIVIAAYAAMVERVSELLKQLLAAKFASFDWLYAENEALRQGLMVALVLAVSAFGVYTMGLDPLANVMPQVAQASRQFFAAAIASFGSAFLNGLVDAMRAYKTNGTLIVSSDEMGKLGEVKE